MNAATKRIQLGIGAVAIALVISSTLTACDYVAQKELQPGISTADDVKRLMGKPEMIWEEKDGSMTMEFPRSPEGHQTYVVEIGADGKYKSMKNILTDESFAKVQAGQSQDDVRKLLGKPTEVVEFKLKNEVVWSWRFSPGAGRSEIFNVHYSPDGKVKTTSKSVDPRTLAG
jgi:SmpA / OmlA family